MAQATEAETQRPNKVDVEDAGPCLKKLKIEIPAETVSEQLGTSLDTLVHESMLPGFRKGRAPARLVERRFGGMMKDEAKKQLIASAYSRAIEDNEIKVVGDPISEGLEDLDLEMDKAFTFEVEVETQPTFEIPSLDGIAVNKPLLEATEDRVKEELDKLCLNEGALEEQSKPVAGDYLTGHAVMTGKDGTEHFNVTDAVIQIPPPEKEGRGMVLGILVEDFSKQIGTPKSGDTVTIKTEGPEHHEVEAIRNDELTIKFEVTHIDRIIPADAGELALRMGLESEDQVRELIRARIEQRIVAEQQQVMRQQVASHLVDAVEMALPERLTSVQAARTLSRRRLELMDRGIDEQQIDEHLAELRSASQETAVRDLKLFFLLTKVAEHLEVKVSEGEINGRIAQIAMSRGERPEKVRKDLMARNMIGQIFVQVQEHKTLDSVLAKAKVTEMSLEDFRAAMGEDGDEGAAPAKKTTTKKKTTKKKTSKKSD